MSEIITYPDPRLRQFCEEVTEFGAESDALVLDLSATMREHNGLGLAAPQLGVTKRVAVMRERPDGPILALFNPEIVRRSEHHLLADEGCLSLPGLRLPIWRPEVVTVRFDTPKGQPRQRVLKALAARIALHEIDHLAGVLILDRAAPDERRAALASA